MGLTDTEVARLYTEERLNIRVIAELARCSWGAISAALRRQGVPSRSPGGQPTATVNEISRDKWHELYWGQRLSIEDLRGWVKTHHGLDKPPSWETVRRALLNAGITLRTSGEQVRVEFCAGRRKPTLGHQGHKHSLEAREKIAAAARKRRRKRRKPQC